MNISKKGPFFSRECNNKTNEVQCTSLEFLWNMGNSNKLWPTRVPTLHSDQICRSTFLHRIPELHICCVCVIAMNIATELPCYLQPPTTVCCTMRSKLSLFAQVAHQLKQLKPPVCWPTYWTYGHTHMVITLLLRIYLRLLKKNLAQTHTVRNKQWFEFGKHSIYNYIYIYSIVNNASGFLPRHSRTAAALWHLIRRISISTLLWFNMRTHHYLQQQLSNSKICLGG